MDNKTHAYFAAQSKLRDLKRELETVERQGPAKDVPIVKKKLDDHQKVFDALKDSAPSN